ncbi:MAG: caspase family protein [Dehalococcoidales bacterium]|nr:caspase family protein [Dehalococcoidales bacterium]
MSKKIPFAVSVGTLLAILCVPFCPCTSAVAREGESESWAVIIGVSRYPSFVSFCDEGANFVCHQQLEYPANGPQALAQQLGSTWGEDHVKLLLDSEATKVDIYYAIKWLADRADSDDIALLYFSGRGREPDAIGQVPSRDYSQKAGSGYLCPFDSRPPASEYYKIPAISLACWFGGSPSGCRHDRACWFDSPPSRCDPGASGLDDVVSQVDRAGWYDNGLSHCDYEISASDLARWLGMVEAERAVIILDTCFAGSFNTELSQDGRVILMACGPDEEALQCPELEDRVFTHHLVQGLSQFDATDTNHDYELSAEEIFGYAEAEIGNGSVTCNAAMSGECKQHPVLSDCYSGELGLLMKVVFDSGAHLPPEATVLTLDGKPYLAADLPASCFWAAGSAHEFDVVSEVDTENGTRLVFVSWDDGYESVSRTISRGGEYRVEYRTQYRLTIESTYGDPKGEGWYDSGSTATVSVTPSQGIVIRRVFAGWSGDLVGAQPAGRLTMDGPKAVTANWHTDYLRLYILAAATLALFGTTAAVYMLRRRKSS